MTYSVQYDAFPGSTASSDRALADGMVGSLRRSFFQEFAQASRRMFDGVVSLRRSTESVGRGSRDWQSDLLLHREGSAEAVEFSLSAIYGHIERLALRGVVPAQMWSESRAVKLSILSERLAGFLSSDLADAGARDCLAESVIDALTFVQLIPAGIELPNRSAYSDDGEVVLRWEHGDKCAEVAFIGGGEAEYTFLRDGRFVPGGEEARPASFPSDLKKYLLD